MVVDAGLLGESVVWVVVVGACWLVVEVKIEREKGASQYMEMTFCLET